MSIEVREWVCTQLSFQRDSQQTDLLNPSLTTTELIAFLQELLLIRNGIWQNHALIVTAVRSDHLSYDGPNGHAGGNAIDFSQNGPDDAKEHLVRDCQACDGAKGIGLGGPFQEVADACGGYNPQSKLFQDNDTDHIHVQVVDY